MLERLKAMLVDETGRETGPDSTREDRLTGLPDRAMLDFFLERSFAAAVRGMPLSIALFGVDGLKSYNERHGHRAGDGVLKLVGNALKKNTRAMDVSGRFEDDQFLTIVPGEAQPSAEIAAERVRRAVESQRTEEGETITVSVGVATHEPEMRSVEDLLSLARGALHTAKENGRNFVAVASPVAETARKQA